MRARRVAVSSASSATMPGVQASGARTSPPGKSAMKTAMPAMATTLFSTGAHMYGPKLPRALRTWLSIEYAP